MASRRKATVRDPEAAAVLRALFDETRLLMHRLKASAESMHGRGPGSASMRSVLISLERMGPRTVPDLARARPVSRQHMQLVVNALAEEGLVELVENPRHKRSQLVRLTAAGRTTVTAMEQREVDALGSLVLDVPIERVREAAAVLSTVRMRLADARWSGDTTEERKQWKKPSRRPRSR